MHLNMDPFRGQVHHITLCKVSGLLKKGHLNTGHYLSFQYVINISLEINQIKVVFFREICRLHTETLSSTHSLPLFGKVALLFLNSAFYRE